MVSLSHTAGNSLVAALIIGLVIGFISAIPVAGPVAAMVIERAMKRRFLAALALANGSAMAEAVYAFLAVLGFSAVADKPWTEPASKALAGVILVAVGLLFALRRPRVELGGGPIAAKIKKPDAFWAQWLIGFGVTIVNPTLLATWAAATSTLVASGWIELVPLTGVPFGLGVAAGATLWFALMIFLIKRFGRNIKPETVDRVLKGIGWALAALGLYFVIQFILWMIG
ncbi:MAG: threonine/homoserine/homoserine lactone efflux protein [Myxococcota bacterium]|jgi:threonine/homoserine/homoserine lactone efflux protein